MTRPLAIAHRGASALEVENSIAAFRVARELGADAVELDVHATADGALLVHHDDLIAGHLIADHPLATFLDHRLRNGEHVPTLDEALAAIVPRMIAFVEVKALAPRWDPALFEAIDRSGAADRVRIHSFDHRIVRRLGEARPDIARGALSASYTINPAQMIEDAHAQALWQEATLIDVPLVAAVHAAHGRVYAWTVDRLDQMKLLLEAGVDGLCSNHPDRARKAIDSLPS